MKIANINQDHLTTLTFVDLVAVADTFNIRLSFAYEDIEAVLNGAEYAFFPSWVFNITEQDGGYRIGGVSKNGILAAEAKHLAEAVKLAETKALENLLNSKAKTSSNSVYVYVLLKLYLMWTEYKTDVFPESNSWVVETAFFTMEWFNKDNTVDFCFFKQLKKKMKTARRTIDPFGDLGAFASVVLNCIYFDGFLGKDQIMSRAIAKNQVAVTSVLHPKHKIEEYEKNQAEILRQAKKAFKKHKTGISVLAKANTLTVYYKTEEKLTFTQVKIEEHETIIEIGGELFLNWIYPNSEQLTEPEFEKLCLEITAFNNTSKHFKLKLI